MRYINVLRTYLHDLLTYTSDNVVLMLLILLLYLQLYVTLLGLLQRADTSVAVGSSTIKVPVSCCTMVTCRCFKTCTVELRQEFD